MLQEISQKKAFAEQQLLIVRQQKAARTREGRMLELTSAEVSSLPSETKVYEGVGKMYVHTQVEGIAGQPRFVNHESSLIVIGSFARRSQMFRNVSRKKRRQERLRWQTWPRKKTTWR
jgi:hypothetical protein